ncbi:hypothetical protein ABIA06_003291 [Bradyrhizobium yuanmingense]|uniref:hypothetical protein n=1 Tax=Bradyrhizobium yuanmingense TaxID=108015 RepID=UPI00351761C2
MTHVPFELMKVSVGGSKADPILAELREHVSDGDRREILNVNIDEKVLPPMRRQLCPAEGSQSKGCDQQTAQQRGAVVADPPLGQVDQQHPALVHDLADVEITLRSS